MFCAVTTEITVIILRKKDFQIPSLIISAVISVVAARRIFRFPMFSLVTMEDCAKFRSTCLQI